MDGTKNCWLSENTLQKIPNMEPLRAKDQVFQKPHPPCLEWMDHLDRSILIETKRKEKSE